MSYHAKPKERTPAVVVQLNCSGVQKALAQLARGAEETPGFAPGQSHSVTETATPILACLPSMHESVAEEQSIEVI